jgi:hypothetical protein
MKEGEGKEKQEKWKGYEILDRPGKSRVVFKPCSQGKTVIGLKKYN